MKLHQRVPLARQVSVPELLRRLSGAATLPPFDPSLVALCSDLSARLMDHPAARQFPELMALGFWLRKAELTRLARAFTQLETPQTLLAPRGLVFHLPPANVDTISVYAWALSLLLGNRNLVRLSSRPSPITDLIVDLLSASLAAAPPALREGTAMVTYGHEPELTAALSAAADVRMVWGGDAAVRAVRAVPLPPQAIELTFPDRWSLCAIDCAAWQGLDDAGLDRQARAFFNDAYWFDQLGCASPRLLVWIGQAAAACGPELFTRVAAEAARRGWRTDAGAALDKVHFAARAVLDSPVSRVTRFGEAVTVLELDDLTGLSRDHVGGGIFYQASLPSLEDLAAHIQRRDQTLTHFGFSDDRLRTFARSLRGRGLDRIVPVGQALSFSRYWDGWDLLQGLSRRVHVRGQR